MEILLFVHLLITVCGTLAEVQILTTAPVNPVKKGGILSIHCQVNGLEPGQSITLSRQLKDSSQIDRLSWDLAMTVQDERIFLAVRQLEDGSLVYFLSVLQVTRADEGIYFCTASASNLNVVAEEFIKIEIQHFPDDPYPECFPPDKMQVEVGDLVAMSCVSEAGYPVVDMTWKRTGSGKVATSPQQDIQNSTVRSVLEFRATVNDNGAVFLCEISSTAFPMENKKTCHVGPLVVTQNGQVIKSTPPKMPDIPRVVTTVNSKAIPTKPIRQTPKSCLNRCSSLDGPLFYWVIATIFAGVLALILLIVIIIFSVKLYNRTSEEELTVSTFITRYPTEDAYEKLEYKRNNNKTYMELQRNCLQKNVVSMDVESQGQYVVTPSQTQ